MTRRMLKSKIHRATVTLADLDYEGSIAIDGDLLAAADILPFEMVSVWNLSSGSRFETYAIPEVRGSGCVCVNGAAARLVSCGDLLIIASWLEMDDADAKTHEPKLIFVDKDNRVKSCEGKTTRLASI